ncbi:hypothetical protein NOF04DRAFT_1351777 [Fusarium oxysporum II5]|nr:hypothetical protein NOF04DRAFT_1351777 [Fusarium oxysporum II5]
MISEDIPSESNAVLIYAPSVTFFIVTPIFILFRIWSHVARRSSLGWDDTTIIISFSSALTVQTVMVVSCSYGFGRHIETLTTDDKLMALKPQPYQSGSAIHSEAPGTSLSSQLALASTRTGTRMLGFPSAPMPLILMLQMQPIWISQLPVAHKRALMMVLTMGGGVVIVTSIVRMTTLDLATKTLDTYIVSQCIDGSRGQTGAGNPYVRPRSVQGLTRSVVLPNDEASEEVILGSLERTDTPSTLASAAGVIRKTVEYGVTYETNPEANP